jgi:hypothetical protein
VFADVVDDPVDPLLVPEPVGTAGHGGDSSPRY